MKLTMHHIYLKVSHNMKMYKRGFNLMQKDACDEMTLDA